MGYFNIIGSYIIVYKENDSYRVITKNSRGG